MEVSGQLHALVYLPPVQEPPPPCLMAVSYCNTTWHHNPDDLDLNLHHCENLKSFVNKFLIKPIIFAADSVVVITSKKFWWLQYKSNGLLVTSWTQT
jgi:hypothetical protein